MGRKIKSFSSYFMITLLVFCHLVFPSEKFIPIFLPEGQVVYAELAVTDQERQRGLMFREGLNPDQGMLFVFEREAIHSFWMKNMKFCIDIIWLDKDKRIVHIEKNVPPCKNEDCPSYTPAALSKYVLEIKGGFSEKYELNLYDRVEFILDL